MVDFSLRSIVKRSFLLKKARKSKFKDFKFNFEFKVCFNLNLTSKIKLKLKFKVSLRKNFLIYFFLLFSNLRFSG